MLFLTQRNKPLSMHAFNLLQSWNHTMGVGRGERGVLATWSLNFLPKKVVLLVLSEKKQISPLLARPGKILEKPLVPPLEKILPTPMNHTLCFAHVLGYLFQWGFNKPRGYHLLCLFRWYNASLYSSCICSSSVIFLVILSHIFLKKKLYNQFFRS